MTCRKRRIKVAPDYGPVDDSVTKESQAVSIARNPGASAKDTHMAAVANAPNQQHPLLFSPPMAPTIPHHQHFPRRIPLSLPLIADLCLPRRRDSRHTTHTGTVLRR